MEESEWLVLVDRHGVVQAVDGGAPERVALASPRGLQRRPAARSRGLRAE